MRNFILSCMLLWQEMENMVGYGLRFTNRIIAGLHQVIYKVSEILKNNIERFIQNVDKMSRDCKVFFKRPGCMDLVLS